MDNAFIYLNWEYSQEEDHWKDYLCQCNPGEHKNENNVEKYLLAYIYTPILAYTHVSLLHRLFNIIPTNFKATSFFFYTTFIFL